MGRILAIDYGKKRCGIAVTDPLQMIASPLQTISTKDLDDFISTYTKEEEVEIMVIGLPLKIDNSPTDVTAAVYRLKEKLELKYQHIPVKFQDEKFTTILAHDAMIRGGMKKKERRKKENVDKISAALILQSFMSMKK